MLRKIMNHKDVAGSPVASAPSPSISLKSVGVIVLHALVILFLIGTQASANAKVVATVDGSEITDQDVRRAYETLPEETRKPLDEVYSAILNRLIDQRLLEIAAQKAKIAEEPQVRENLQKIRDRLLREEYLRRQLEGKITDSAVREKFEEIKDEYDGQQEVRARHILVEEKSKAEDIIKKLEGGADFAELAKKESTGPSASRGGDLGYFVRGSMVPAFANAAYNLDEGAYTKSPVQTRFGWHVIKVEDKRTAKAPPFEQVRQDLENALREQEIRKVLNDLRQDSKIEIKESS